MVAFLILSYYTDVRDGQIPVKEKNTFESNFPMVFFLLTTLIQNVGPC